MPSADGRLIHVTLKVERAKQHVASLEREITGFLQTNPYQVQSKHDPQTRKLVYYVARVEPTPRSLPVIAGDVIQNLMTALDHLAYQLVCIDTADNPPTPAQIYFPIANSAKEYKAAKARKLKGASRSMIAAIDALKPYKGGNNDLWVLWRLNNLEKHRLLLTVGSHAAGVNLLHYGLKRSLASSPEWAKEATVIAMQEWRNKFIREVGDRGFPLKAGYELFIAGVDEESDPDLPFAFDVAIDEPAIIQSESLLKTMRSFVTTVEGIVTGLAPRLN